MHNIYTRALRGAQINSNHLLLVGINLSGLWTPFVLSRGGFAHMHNAQRKKKKKKNVFPPTPIFPKFVLDAAILARKRGRGGVSAFQVDPRCGTAYAPRSEPCAPRGRPNQPLHIHFKILILCHAVPALTETLSHHPSLPFRLVPIPLSHIL